MPERHPFRTTPWSQLPEALRLCCLGFMLLLLPSMAVAAATPANTTLSADIPATAADGQAFPCTVSGPGILSVTFSFLGRSVTVPATGTAASPVRSATALMPVPLEYKSENATEALSWAVTLSNGQTVLQHTPVTVVAKEYPVQRLTLDKKYVTPDPSLKARIDEERRRTSQAFALRSPERRWDLPLSRPLPGGISSTFGVRRVLNGQTRSAHKGVDFRGKSGDPVGVVADGSVVLTGDFYYAGNCVIVDHGLGVVSMYMHLSRVDVAQGQPLRRGDIVGRVGSTGRSTGPHLHLSFGVLGQSADALPLMEAPENAPAQQGTQP